MSVTKSKRNVNKLSDEMALASTLCALMEHMSVAKQTSSIPLHGRVRRGREWVHPFGCITRNKQTHLHVQLTSPQVTSLKKEKRKSNNKLNKSLEQGLNLSGS